MKTASCGMIAGEKPRNNVDEGFRTLSRKGDSSVRWDFRHVEETGSTNEDAMLLGRKGAPAGVVCIADCQLHGRGRMDRSWFSPPGAGLYCSVLLRPSLSLQSAGLLSFCAALAMTNALRETGLCADVKWPNDIVSCGKKLCGILSACEGDGDRIRFAVIGSGLNLLPGSYPEELRGHAACLADFGIHADRKTILLRYLESLESAVKTLETDGFEPLRQQLEKVCVLLGRPVIVSGGQQAEGIAEGIGDHGELLLRLESGSLCTVTCGDVSVRGVNGYV